MAVNKNSPPWNELTGIKCFGNFRRRGGVPPRGKERLNLVYWRVSRHLSVQYSVIFLGDILEHCLRANGYER